MINEKCFTPEWLESFKKQKEHELIQTNILEKMIYAFHLLEQFENNGLEFVFKGGTSLVLLLEEGNRFSIDIDIICKTERKELEAILDKVIESSKFTSVALNERRSYKAGVPKAHYSFYFESVFNTKTPGNILLDILVEDSIYPELIESTIQTKWIETDNGVTVKTPSIDAITGDKLTAFGTGYLMSGNFRIDDAVIAASKVAHLCAKLLVGDLNPISHYDGRDIKPLTIEEPEWNFLNKLKKQPEKSSFYYWYQMVQLLTNKKM